MFIVNQLLDTLKKSVSFKGRASRFEFWLFFFAVLLLNIIFGVLGVLAAGSTLGTILCIIFLLIDLVLLVPYISVSVRRLHDLGLSGFWLWYLNPCGLPVIFVVYLLDLDKACNALIAKIQNTGSVWLGWILTFLFWPAGSTMTLFLLFLYAGKKEENEFGPAPTPVAIPCCCGKTAEN